MDVVTVVKRSPIVFPLACVAAVTMLFVSEGSYWRSVETLDELGNIQIGRTGLLELHLGILDAETGQRGYLLTDRKDYLEPYTRGLNEIENSLKTLDRYYGGNAKSSAALAKLQALAEAKLSELALTIRLHDEGRREAATEITLSAIGSEQMNAIRTLSAELLEIESQSVVVGRVALYKTLLLSRIGMAALSAISLLALFLYLRQTFEIKRQQQDLKAIVQAERDRLKIEATQHTAELTELTRHLLTAREDERQRLARNLHDELGALLTSAKLDAARIKSRLAGAAPEALERLAHLVDTLNSSIALGRRIIEDLRPSTLGNLGLVPTLEILVRECSEASGVDTHCSLTPVRLTPASELVIYRLVQEAFTNITKYAKASHAWVGLDSNDGHATVSVRDDGVGFDTTQKPRSAYGLAGMRFRVEAEGGSFEVVSAPGQGTLIRATLREPVPCEA